MEDDGDDKDDSKRRTRNLSEKKRRDQFNMLVNELSTMISTNSRKMDKSTVLKSTISFLRNHNELTVRSRAHDVQEDWKPAFLSNEEFTYLVLEALEGFLMVFSSTGKIFYVSDSIASLLGHNPADVVNKTIFDLAYEEDRPNLYGLLQKNAAAEQSTTGVKEQEMVMFDMRLRRGALDFRDDPVYEMVTFNGHFRTNMDKLDDVDMSGHQNLESRTCVELNIPEIIKYWSRTMFVCTGRLPMPQLIRDVSLVDLNRSEFTSRHSLEWKFLFLDHRAPPIIGYLPFEVLGTSGYDYYHFDDLEKVVTCHEALMEKGEITSCFYRFLTKGQQWIWLQTRFYITYHQWNSKPEFVVCTHRVVSYQDLLKGTKEEGPDADAASDSDNRCMIKEAPPSEDAGLVSMSPSYMSDASDAFGSYQGQSQSESEQRVKDAPSDDAAMASASPSYMSEGSEAYTAYRPPSQTESRRRMKEPHSDDAIIPSISPTYMSETSEPYMYTRSHSQAGSMKGASGSGAVSAAAASGGMWARHRYSNSDNGCGQSRSSGRHAREKKRMSSGYDRCMMMYPGHKGPEPQLAPQHAIGAQYLDPTPYVGVPVPAVLPLPSLPVIVSQDQAQLQEQLQRKHEELQQMIVRQQEELRQVKEQLLLARLGILQPIINVPYANPEELQHQTGHMRQLPYEGGPRGGMPYPPGPPHPQHPPGSHHHMQ